MLFKRTFFQLLTLLIIIGMISCIKPNPGADKQKLVQTVIDKLRKNLSDSLRIAVPSVNVFIQTPTDKIFVSSYEGEAQKVTADSRFRFASNTKNFTATSILNMHEDGWLDYKAKIVDLMPGSVESYIPAGAEWDFPYKNQITIEQLLQHAAGVYDVDNDTVPGYGGETYTEYIQDREPTHQFTTVEMIKVLREKNLFYWLPGTAHHYSNTGFSILSEIISRVYTSKTGKYKTYSDYLQDYIVGPYARVPLNTVQFPVYASDVTMPRPHVIGTELNPGSTKKFEDYNMTGQIGEGNGYGSMQDLNTYVRTLMKGENVLKPATIKLMQSDFAPGDKRYALGCTLEPNLGYGHNGARIGYISIMAYDPLYDVSVVAMIPLWDLRDGTTSFLKVLTTVYDAGYNARQALGYPGRP